MLFCRVESLCCKNVTTTLITANTNMKSDTPWFNYLHETCGKSFSTISRVTVWKVSKYGTFFWSVFSKYRKIRTRKAPYFNSLQALDISNFCDNANTQPSTELKISRTEKALEALPKILSITLCENRVVTKFLRNILTNFLLLSEQCAINMNNTEGFLPTCVAQLFQSIPSMCFTNELGWSQLHIP